VSARVKPTRRIVLLAAIGALLFGALGLILAGLGQEGFRAAARFTARWSFACFLLVWSAAALAALWPGGWRGALRYNRRGFGLAFAAAHFIHAGFFSVAIWVMGAPSSVTTLIGGGLGYVFVALMALTSNDASVRALTPKGWKLLHTIGAAYVALIFTLTYFNRLGPQPALGAAGLTAIALVVTLKLAAWAKKRRLQPA
jgi:sulfoxide reductase heme-binding subunit YedZ